MTKCLTWMLFASKPCDGEVAYFLDVPTPVMIHIPLCVDCAREAEHGIRDGSMILYGRPVSASARLISSPVG